MKKQTHTGILKKSKTSKSTSKKEKYVPLELRKIDYVFKSIIGEHPSNNLPPLR